MTPGVCGHCWAGSDGDVVTMMLTTMVMVMKMPVTALPVVPAQTLVTVTVMRLVMNRFVLLLSNALTVIEMIRLRFLHITNIIALGFSY